MLHPRILLMLIALLQIPLLAHAGNIYLDEDFEASPVFADRNWPIRNTTAPLTLPILQGINLRANSDGETSPKVQISPNRGSVVSSRAYRGSQSYRLSGGQALGCAPGQFPSRNIAGFRFWQFAISVDAPLPSIPTGAEMGRFQIDFSTNGNDLTAEKSIILRLQAGQSGQIELVCSNNGAPLGVLSGQPNDWLLVSIVANPSLATGREDLISSWRSYDPVTDTFKGPDFAIPTGVHVYAKTPESFRKTSLLRSDALGSAWGNINNESTNTGEIGWKFQAATSATLYVDNLYWDCSNHSSETSGFATEQSARMERAVGVMLAPLFSDNAVIQREAPVAIWGTADPGKKIAIDLNGARASAVADAKGRWRATLRTGPAGGPYLLRAAGNGEVVRSNILLGDVWLCSGQSNMAWKVIETDNAAQEIAAANYPGIRLLEIPWTPSETPLQNPNSAQWEPATPDAVTSFSATAWYFGRDLYTSLSAQVPMGLIMSCVGATRAEDWTSLEALQGNPEFAPLIGTEAAFGVSRATYLFNGMINPLIPYALKGAIWYQGESNADSQTRALAYRRLLPLMVNDWRTRWEVEFPFLHVQLPLFNSGGNWPELRESQLDMLTSTRNTGMAIILDLGNPSNIHPANKHPVGYRLARAALGRVYGQPLTWSGPLYRSQTIESNKIRIAFDQVGASLVDKNGGALQGFQIAGANKAFVAANAVIDGSTVVVSAASVASPQFVRYAWAPNPVADLFNADGLAASQFRTDLPASNGATPTPHPTMVPTPTPTPQPNAAVPWCGY